MYIYIYTHTYKHINTYTGKCHSEQHTVPMLSGQDAGTPQESKKIKLEPPGSRNLPAFSRVLGVICDMSPKWGTWAKGP